METYWFDVFTKETWEEALVEGLSASGFSETKRSVVQQVKPGDILLCYLKGAKKLVGAIRVIGEPYFSREPRIWKSQEFPARLPVEPIVTLDFDQAVNLTSILPGLSFYDPDNLKRTYARFQGSPTKLPEADGQLMFAAIQDAAAQDEAKPRQVAPQEPESPVRVERDVPVATRVPDPPAVAETDVLRFLTDPLDNLISEIQAAQRDASHPSRFEQAVERAFRFLGFDTEWYGQSGTTDVVVDSPLGHDRFRAIVDAKASTAGRVNEGQITWPAIDAHRKRAAADHAVIVGERFAGGNLNKYASDINVALVDTPVLIEVLRLHAATTFSAADLRPLLATAGPVTAVVADLRQKAQSTKRHWQLIADIVRLVDGFSRTEPPLTPTAGNLHAVLVSRALERHDQQRTPPSEQDVRNAVVFLSCRAVGILRSVDADSGTFRLAMSARSALQRLRALDGAIRGMMTEGVSQDRTGRESATARP